jgi:hypothetical protein
MYEILKTFMSQESQALTINNVMLIKTLSLRRTSFDIVSILIINMILNYFQFLINYSLENFFLKRKMNCQFKETSKTSFS